MKRLDNGLAEGLDYIRDETGKINWLKMIPKEHLYINQDRKGQIEKRLGKKMEEVTIEEVLDSEQVITLPGIMFLLNLRGFEVCDLKLDVASPDYAAATCHITFIASEGECEKMFTSSASAHPNNTKSFYSQYLVEAATNRAICRAVRFFLNLNCISREELGVAGEKYEDAPGSSVAPLPITMLKNLMEEKKISFEKIKARLVKDGLKEAADYDSLEKIPDGKIYELIVLCENKK